MEEIVMVLKKKSQIMYDMNCIGKYIGAGECDKSLQSTWDRYNDELEEIESELELLSNPETKPFEEKKLELLHKIEDHERDIGMLRRQVKDIEHRLESLLMV